MSFPDIEIYVKNLSVNEISIWLDKLFGESPTSRLGSTTLVQLRNCEREMECRILENAVEPEFTSIYFSLTKPSGKQILNVPGTRLAISNLK